MKALFLNTSLTPAPALSNTEALMRESAAIFDAQGFDTEIVRVVDLGLAYGVEKDMGDGDGWPALFEKVMAAEVLVVGSPIWIGNPSSLSIQLLERLYAHASDTNAQGQYVYYGKVAGCVVTGNEDGAKFASRNILYSLAHIGFTIPPGADAYWVGEAGPGPATPRPAREARSRRSSPAS